MSVPAFFSSPLYTDSVSAAAFAADEKSPYGSSEGGKYGEKRAVSSKDEARGALREYFSKRNVRVGKITERQLYFEAEITGKNNEVVDVVIIDKRTGRIRSIY